MSTSVRRSAIMAVLSVGIILFISIMLGTTSTTKYGEIFILIFLALFCLLFCRKLFKHSADFWVAIILLSWSVAPSFHIGKFNAEIGDILVFLGIVCFYQRVRGHWISGLFERAFIVYIATALLSVLVLTWYTSSYLSGVSSAFRIFRLVGDLFIIALIRSRGSMQTSEIYRILDFAIFGSVVACIITLIEFKHGVGMSSQQFFTLDGVQMYRAGGTIYENAGEFGNYESILFGIALWMTYQCRGPRRFFYLLSSVLFAFGAISSYSRAAMLGLVVAYLILWIGNRGKFRSLMGVVITLGALIVAMEQFMPGYITQVWDTRIIPLFSISNTQGFNLAGGGRVTFWKESFAFIASNIWSLITGVGYYGVTYAAAVFHQPMYTDNNYVSAILEQGLLGLISLVCFVFTPIVVSLRRLSLGSTSWLVLALWVSEALQAFTGDIFTFWKTMPILFCVTAVFLQKHVNGWRKSNVCISDNSKFSTSKLSV